MLRRIRHIALKQLITIVVLRIIGASLLGGIIRGGGVPRRGLLSLDSGRIWDEHGTLRGAEVERHNCDVSKGLIAASV
jgi:hypothetical protein